MRKRGVLVGVVVACGGLALALTGCATGPGTTPGTCVPRIDARPAVAHPGETVTLTSADVCTVRVPDGGWTVVVRQDGTDGRRAAVRTSQAFDGSWSVSIPLPTDFPAGDTSAGVENWEPVPCPGDASCASPVTSLTVTGSSATPTAAP